MNNTNSLLKKAADDHILIAAHRGVCGGNIPCNTLASYGIALRQNADILEIDVDKSSDGKLFVFHRDTEPVYLKYNGYLKDLPFSEIEKMKFYNNDDTITQFGINTLDEVFEKYGDKCFFNVDKFWFNPKEISEKIREYGLEKRAIIKCSYNEAQLKDVEDYAPDLMFMPIIRSEEALDDILSRNINCVGAEILFDTEDSLFASDEFIKRAHDKGLLLWVNAIIYNHKVQLAARHSDDTSLTGDPKDGWGWLADKKFDIIQTDWSGMCIDYLKSAGQYYKK